MKKLILTIPLIAFLLGQIAAQSYRQDALLSPDKPIALLIKQKIESWMLTVGMDIEVEAKDGVYTSELCLIRKGALASAKVKTIKNPSPNYPALVTIEVNSVEAIDGQTILLKGYLTLAGEEKQQVASFEPEQTIQAHPTMDYTIKAISRR